MTSSDDSFDFARYQLMTECCEELRRELSAESVCVSRVENILIRMALLVDGDVFSRMDRIVAHSKSENLIAIWSRLRSSKEFQLKLKEFQQNEKEKLE